MSFFLALWTWSYVAACMIQAIGVFISCMTLEKKRSML